MKTAIIGTGNMGAGLARRLAGKRDLILASRNGAAAKSIAEEIGSSSAPIATAVAEADIVVLALPYGSALEFAGSEALEGKILIDITNPLKPDFSGLLFANETSAAEQLQSNAKGAKVVKAFNTIFAELFAASPDQTVTIPVFLAGDEDAVEISAALVRDAGFAVEKIGSLDAARLLEPLGMLNIRLGYGLGRGTGIAPKWAVVQG